MSKLHVVTCLKCALIFEWCEREYGCKNGHQKNMYFKSVVTACSNYLLIILTSTVNIIVGH